MAAAAVASMGSEQQHQRTSLLDCVLAKRLSQSKTILLTRLTYVARLTESAKGLEPLQGLQRRLLDRTAMEGFPFTGMMIVWPAVVVHILEGPTSAVMAYLRALKASTDTRLQRVTVIASTEDIPERAYNRWQAAFINSGSAADRVDAIEAPLLVNTACDVSISMINIGRQLSDMPEPEAQQALTSLQAAVDGLPTPDAALSMVAAEEAPSVDEYLQLFDTPMNIVLDSELTWPAA